MSAPKDKVAASGIAELSLQVVKGTVPITVRRLGPKENIPGPVYLFQREMVPAQSELAADYLVERGGVKRYDAAAYAALRSAMDTAVR